MTQKSAGEANKVCHQLNFELRRYEAETVIKGSDR